MTDLKFSSDIAVRLIQSVGGDSMVCAAAKVSTSGEEAAGLVDDEANAGLINYLLKHRHGTPFEHASLTFFVHAPIFVWREWHRHRIGFSYNEESGRYKQLEPVFWIPRRDRKMVPEPNFKPAKPKFVPASDEQHAMVVTALKSSYAVAYERYEQMINNGIAKELARACLPVGIYSSCWVTCNPRSLMSFLSLRTHQPEGCMFISYPQAEIEEAAVACEFVLKRGWPITWKAFNSNGRVGP